MPPKPRDRGPGANQLKKVEIRQRKQPLSKETVDDSDAEAEPGAEEDAPPPTKKVKTGKKARSGSARQVRPKTKEDGMKWNHEKFPRGIRIADEQVETQAGKLAGYLGLKDTVEL
jgi:hypothetical protein